MTQNQAVAQFAIALPQPNLPQQLGQANQFTAIPENDRALKLVELKAIARQFDLMAQVVECGSLNQKASYVKALEAYRHQHQYEAAIAANGERTLPLLTEDEPTKLQAIEATGEFRCTVGDCTIREVAGIAYLDAPSGSYQFKAGLGECDAFGWLRLRALSTTPETLSQIIAHLQKFNGRTSFPTTFAQAVFAIEQQSQQPTPMMDWAQKLNQAFAGVSVIGSRDRHISHTHNISFHSSNGT